MVKLENLSQEHTLKTMHSAGLEIFLIIWSTNREDRGKIVDGNVGK